MLTFTSLSGSARSSSTSPLAYLLQVDDVRILLDCGSPDWCPEASSSAVKTEDMDAAAHTWDKYCTTLKECVLDTLLDSIDVDQQLQVGAYGGCRPTLTW
jgi:cleavage and polyadenylation specificity factor subunit 2